MPKEIPLLHLYAQPCWHDAGWLVGTREGLECLRAAVHAVLANTGPGEVRSPTVFAIDGEGFQVRVVLVTEAGMQGYVLPYTDAMAQDPDADTPSWPKKGDA